MINTEVTQIHTRLLRSTLLEEDSQNYWRQHLHNQTSDEVNLAYDNYWFGSANKATIKRTLTNLHARYINFPNCLEVLNLWKNMTVKERAIICHWHVQLSDVLYRRFTSEFIPSRFIYTPPTFHKDQAQQWVYSYMGAKWAGSTQAQLASKMMSCIRSTGLVASESKDTIQLQYPLISNHCLTYILYALREISFQGNMLENPYLKSVGLTGSFLISQINQSSALSVQQIGDTISFEWKYPSLVEWGKHEFQGVV